MSPQGVAGIRPAYVNSSYVQRELAHAFTLTEASHVVVHRSLLRTVITTLLGLGFAEGDVKKRVIVMARRIEISQDIIDGGWKGVDDLIPNWAIKLPERFDGAASEETAAIYFSSGWSAYHGESVYSHLHCCGF